MECDGNVEYAENLFLYCDSCVIYDCHLDDVGCEKCK
jgi:hypothetical protein